MKRKKAVTLYVMPQTSAPDAVPPLLDFVVGAVSIVTETWVPVLAPICVASVLVWARAADTADGDGTEAGAANGMEIT